MSVIKENYDTIQKSGMIGLGFYSIFVILSICFMVYARTIFNDRIPNKGYGYTVPKPSKNIKNNARNIANQKYDLSLNKNPDRIGLEEGDECTFDGTPCKHPYTCGYKPGKNDELHCRHCLDQSCTLGAEVSECCHGHACVQTKFATDNDHRSSLGGHIGVCRPEHTIPKRKYEGSPNNHDSKIPVKNDEIVKKHDEYWKNRKITQSDKTKENYTNMHAKYKHPEHEELGAHALSNYNVSNNSKKINYIDSHVKIIDDYEQCDNLKLLNKRIETKNRLRYNQEDYHVENPTCKEGSSCLYIHGKSSYCVPNHYASTEPNLIFGTSTNNFKSSQNDFHRNMIIARNRINNVVKNHGGHFYRSNKPQKTYKYPKTNIYYSMPN